MTADTAAWWSPFLFLVEFLGGLFILAQLGRFGWQGLRLIGRAIRAAVFALDRPASAYIARHVDAALDREAA